MKRAEILATATEYVTKDRAATHGKAEDNFRTIANFWTEYIRAKYPEGLTRGNYWLDSVDVGWMMVLFKTARGISNPGNPDNYIDGSGYLACAGEIATEIDPISVGGWQGNHFIGVEEEAVPTTTVNNEPQTFVQLTPLEAMHVFQHELVNYCVVMHEGSIDQEKVPVWRVVPEQGVFEYIWIRPYTRREQEVLKASRQEMEKIRRAVR